MPTSFDPVNDTARMAGCRTIVSPTSRPPPNTRFSTPGGSPHSSKISTMSAAVSGVSDAGLNTTVLPETSAGAIFQIGIAIGKFQGVMIATGPTGCFSV